MNLEEQTDQCIEAEEWWVFTQYFLKNETPLPNPQYVIPSWQEARAYV